MMRYTCMRTVHRRLDEANVIRMFQYGIKIYNYSFKAEANSFLLTICTARSDDMVLRNRQ
jgi:hypothetical protein